MLQQVDKNLPHLLAKYGTRLLLSYLSVKLVVQVAEWYKRICAMNNFPGPRSPSLILGSLNEARHDVCGTLLRWSREYDSTFCYRLIGLSYRIVVTDIESLKNILIIHPRDFHKPMAEIRLLRKIVGNGLLTVDGEDHVRHRKIISEAFHFEALKHLYPIFTSSTERIIRRWRQQLSTRDAKSYEVDLKSEMSALTLDIIGLAAFGFDFNAVEGSHSELRQAYLEILPTAGSSLWMFFCRTFPFLYLFDPSSYFREKRAEKVLRTTVKKIVRERMSQEGKRRDLLGLLIDATDNQDPERKLSEDELIFNVQTFMVAGHETTGNALSWAIYLMASHKDVQAKLRAELSCKVQGRCPALHELNDKNLPYLFAVMKEVFRMYPPAPITFRTTTKDEVIHGKPVGKGTVLVVSPLVLARSPQLWDRPDDFWPERWLQASPCKDEKHPFSWMPFLAGARQCIGRTFAEKEFMSVLALLVQNFTFDISENCPPVVPIWKITLFPGPQCLINISPLDTPL
eukprot:760271-Hanusia_phi.AAC.1